MTTGSDQRPQRTHGASDCELADDLELVGRRDIEALRRVYNETQGRLFGLCMRITQNREAAEDVLQEVYVKMWNRAAGFDRNRSSPLVWLGVIARNSAIDWYRAHSGTRNRSTGLTEILEISDDSKPADEQIIDRQDEQRAIAMLDDLNKDQKEHILDIYFRGLTYTELADRDGVPVGTVKSRTHRAILTLSKRWTDD